MRLRFELFFVTIAVFAQTPAALRFVPMGASSRPLLNAFQAQFPDSQATSARLELPAAPVNGFVAVALRNVERGASNVKLELVSSAGESVGISNVAMPGESVFMRTVQELFGAAPEEAWVRITGDAPVQVLGLIGDDSSATVMTFAESAARAAGTLTVSPASLVFDGAGQKTIAVGSTELGTPFTVSASVGWLTVSPIFGVAPAVVVVTANPIGMVAGRYAGTVTVSPGQSVAVTLNIGVNAVVTVSPTDLVFDGGGTKTLSVGSASAGVSYTASTETTWLTVTPATGVTPGTLNVTATATGLAPGVYVGKVTVSPGQSVSVTMSVAAAPTLTVSPTTLAFDGAGTKTISVGSLTAGAQFTASANAPWLSVTPASGITPAALSVTANPGGMAPGSYSGTVTISPGFSVSVTLNVALPGVMTVSPSALVFDGAGTKTISLSSTGTPVSYTASTNVAWLTVSPGSGVSPATLNVMANPAGLAPGTYTGSVAITPGQNVTVTLTVSTALAITVSPRVLVFDGSGTKTISVDSTGAGVTFTASTDVAWLTVSPGSGTAPARLDVTAHAAGLAPGSYSGTVTVSPGQSVAVTMNVLVASSLTVLPASLVFDGTGVRTLTIGSTGVPLAFTVTSSVAWLSASPTNGITPASVNVTASAAGLPPGTYTGTVNIAPGQMVAVSLTIGGPVSGGPQVTSLVDAASQLAGSSFAPGEIVTLYGGEMGPVTGTGPVIVGGDRVDTVSGGVRVWFGVTPAPILYASATQVNAIVPYEARGLTPVQLEFLGRRSTPREMLVVGVAPAIFTQDSSGRGPAAVLNQDYSLNTPQRRAARGSAIMIYATGGGQTEPASFTGEIASGELKTISSPVRVTIGGLIVQPLYAGVAPGLVAGLLQVNVIIPQQAATGEAVAISITVGGVDSQEGTTISIE